MLSITDTEGITRGYARIKGHVVVVKESTLSVDHEVVSHIIGPTLYIVDFFMF